MGKCFVCGYEDRRKNKDFLCQRCENEIKSYVKQSYLKNGLVDNKGKVLIEMVVDEARKIANYLSWTGKMTATGLRKFYAKMKAIESLYRANQDWPEVAIRLKTMIQNAEYSAKRETVPEIWVTIIEKNINEAIKSEKHFAAMLNHMQGIVAFFKENKEGRR